MPILRPTVLVAPNGVPLVNIQTPSAAGVSRNIYNQFDVQRNGVILNNCRTTAQTQLGGRVQGNPWLASGPARIILNEINSGNPTHCAATSRSAAARRSDHRQPGGHRGRWRRLHQCQPRATLTTGTRRSMQLQAGCARAAS